jgi:uncharacterized protein (TIGR03084 family)
VDAVLTALAEQHAELAGLLAGADDVDWQRPSRCPGWSVADVVLHLAQTDALAIASVRGTFGEGVNAFGLDGGPAPSVDAGVDQMVRTERGQPGRAVRERWASGAATLRQLLASSAPSERVQWVAGQLSVQTLATTRLAECWIHTGDVAAALEVELRPTDRLRHVARLAWRMLPYAFTHAGREFAGPVAFELRGPSGDKWTFAPDGDPVTVVRGDAVELCLVAARRVGPEQTSLGGDGPDVATVLELIRTYA